MNKSNQTKKSTGREPIYEEAFKIAVAREYLKGELGYLKLGNKYKLPITTVRSFIAWYKARFDISNPSTGIQTAPIAPVVQNASTGDGDLRAQLNDALLKIAALETIITIADKENGTSILKKAGAKQSKP